METSSSSVVMDYAVFALFDGISLVASIASLVLAVVAIWLSVSFKRDADRVNSKTTELLTEIRSDAKSISEGVMDELHAYGSAMRGVFAQNTTTNPGDASAKAVDFVMNQTERSKEP